MENAGYAEGSFGHEVFRAGLSWAELGRRTGYNHATLLRWGKADGKRFRVRMRCPRWKVAGVLDTLNERLGTSYTAETFGLWWPLPLALRARTPEQQIRLHVEAISDTLVRLSSDRERFDALAKIGRARRMAEIERAAWTRVWQSYCQRVFPCLPTMHLTPPRGCEWYGQQP